MNTYTVRPGDTLSKIAKKYATDWRTLYAANKEVVGSDPNLIRPGMVLALPGAPASPGGGTSPPPAQTGKNLRDMVSAAVSAAYEPQKAELKSAWQEQAERIESDSRAAQTRYDAARGELLAQRETDIARLLADAENAQLARGGGYNSWLHQQAQTRESDLMRAYERALADRQGDLHTRLADNAGLKELYAKQLADRIAALDAQQQAEYARMLLELEYDEYAARQALENEMKLIAYRNSFK
ncbi:MAG: LysM peptidoglycan-binding domain-containing protein [Clostridiales bacterium]|nr:LysM peptidoglycan-binding domain-containing protein [Clostridiales bacterium]